ncbi:DHH family phosphoesterase [Lottiidibacillus patelloidae]|uniref:DHH family phosphoesterase n=1 Tax=Lottiidibacillus patelloidae TaxID=2670334 RepID=A0A263BW78_9BACI|nr:bifunctional oligoribonuclease/PAP phosphatase NrnA [Lottiidibacillus patelloidae]OZM57965.1 DHH family phosphoesterase [Lottiidibacillus patelloidae]
MKELILQEIKAFDKIVIHRHVRPDPDALGSQGGLAEIIKASFPSKTVKVVGDEDPSLQFLNEMDQIDDSFYEDALVIVCDTANQERISDERYTLGKKLIKIDHHPNDDAYGDILWVDTNACSVSEMIYQFYLFAKEELTLTDNGARLIYAGIVGDTGRFLFPSTNPETFQYASELVKYNFSFTDIYREMYKINVNVARLQGYVLNNFSLTDEGVGFVTLSADKLKEFDVGPSEASQLVGSLGNIEGINAWAFFIEEPDQIRVRLRSKGPVVNKIANRYNGGGHPMAAGATIYNWDKVEEVVGDLVEASKANK